jgi:hypothetical protein
MAPLDISDRINAAAMAGTWVGTLFTAIGLIAILSQLRSVLLDLRQSKKTLLARSTGRWITLIPKKDMPQRGLVERVAPGFLGWVQRAYIEKSHACLTQNNRMIAGTSGWSNIFAHCGIQAADLIRSGGSDARVFPAVTGHLGSGAPRLADLIFDNGRVLYGFSQYEFVALLIISGFSPADFSISGCTTSTKFLGSMQLADNEPFSQVARFDAYEGCRESAEDKERYINKVPVQTCIDYAIGILRTPERGDHSIIIPAEASSTAAGHSELTAWIMRPRTAQLHEIRYALEQLVSISGANVLKYSVETSKDIEYESSAMDTISPGNEFGRAKTHETLIIAHALAALQPWGLLPVLPGHFVQAFKPLIVPFIGSHSETVSVLQERMCKLKLKPLDGWDSIQQQAMALGQIGDIKDEFFSRSCSPCRNYYKAMNMVFDAYRVRVDDVRVTLAALAARRCLDGISIAGEFVPNLMAHLSKGQFSGEVPPWTITVFATYLWGWLNDFVETGFDLHGKFKRRVFLS